MNLKKLSIESRINQVTEFLIEWFMNLFADPDLYWTFETYPSTMEKRKYSTNIPAVSTKQVDKDSFSFGPVNHLVNRLCLKIVYTNLEFFKNHVLNVKNRIEYGTSNCDLDSFCIGIKGNPFLKDLLKVKLNLNFRIKSPLIS